MAGGIFISYRRDDDPSSAGRLFDRLAEAFGPGRVFLDIDIEPGADFVQVLNERVAQSAVFLAVIGVRWIDAVDAAMKRRLEHPGDFVRLEIEAALNQQKRVIPVLVGHAEMPNADQLPESLKPLATRQAVRIRYDRFRPDSEALIGALRKVLAEPPSTPEDNARSNDAGLSKSPKQSGERPPLPANQLEQSRTRHQTSLQPSAPSDLRGEAPRPPLSPSRPQRQAVEAPGSLSPLTERTIAQRRAAGDNQVPASLLPPVPRDRIDADRDRQPKRARAGAVFPFRSAVAIGVALILAGAAILWGAPIFSGVAGWFRSQPSAEAPKDNPAPAIKPKIADRAGEPSAASKNVAPVAQRVVLYDEDPANPKGKQYVGSVVWRTEPIQASGNQKADIAVRADIEVPDRKFKMTMSFRRNTDTSLPASHTAELTFILPQDFAGGGVANVPGIMMKSDENAHGTPLVGLAVKVTDGFFLVGLSNVDSDRARNIQLLKERSWFDVPLVYANQRRAIITIEKGAPGARAFNDAFAAWGE